MKPLSKIMLIAPCGMNCSLCMAFLRDKNKCFGCRGADIGKPITRTRCKIKSCANFQGSHKKYCFECNNFPCKELKHLDKRYRTRYSMSVIDNLTAIKGHGIRAFLRDEKARWTCSKCGNTICVHKGCCHICETALIADSFYKIVIKGSG